MSDFKIGCKMPVRADQANARFSALVDPAESRCSVLGKLTGQECNRILGSTNWSSPAPQVSTCLLHTHSDSDPNWMRSRCSNGGASFAGGPRIKCTIRISNPELEEYHTLGPAYYYQVYQYFIPQVRSVERLRPLHFKGAALDSFRLGLGVFDGNVECN